MHGSLLLVSLAIAPLAPATASYRSTHFVVEAPDAESAGAIARAAERQLSDLSKKWLGRELPGWSELCPITVALGHDAPGGCTTFVFKDGHVARQEVRVEGDLKRILEGVLPHEISHIVLTQHFRRPFPRWADEGGAALAEGERELRRYRERMARIIETPDRRIPLRDLFELTGYPHDVFAFYGTGFSISSYLVTLKGRHTFLEFIAVGMEGDWDLAVRKYYGFNSVEDLEKHWLARIRLDLDRLPDPMTSR